MDPAALQRVSTRRSLISMGVGCTAFDRPADLMMAICGGRTFDAVVLALQADAAETLAALPALREAAGPRSSVLLMTHGWQLSVANELIQSILLEEGVDLILSPVDECELELRLMALILRKKGPVLARHAPQATEMVAVCRDQDLGGRTSVEVGRLQQPAIDGLHARVRIAKQ
jgi:hypothetical protein